MIRRIVSTGNSNQKPRLFVQSRGLPSTVNFAPCHVLFPRRYSSALAELAHSTILDHVSLRPYPSGAKKAPKFQARKKRVLITPKGGSINLDDVGIYTSHKVTSTGAYAQAWTKTQNSTQIALSIKDTDSWPWPTWDISPRNLEYFSDPSTLPTRSDLPTLPVRVEGDDYCSKLLSDGRFTNDLFSRANTQIFTLIRDGEHLCALSCIFADNYTVRAIGKGRLKKQAFQAAVISILSSMYRQGKLGYFRVPFPRTGVLPVSQSRQFEGLMKLDTEEIYQYSSPSSSLKDVYTYCARYGLVPDIIATKSTTGLFSLSLQLPERDIVVSAQHKRATEPVVSNLIASYFLKVLSEALKHDTPLFDETSASNSQVLFPILANFANTTWEKKTSLSVIYDPQGDIWLGRVRFRESTLQHNILAWSLNDLQSYVDIVDGVYQAKKFPNKFQKLIKRLKSTAKKSASLESTTSERATTVKIKNDFDKAFLDREKAKPSKKAKETKLVQGNSDAVEKKKPKKSEPVGKHKQKQSKLVARRIPIAVSEEVLCQIDRALETVSVIRLDGAESLESLPSPVIKPRPPMPWFVLNEKSASLLKFQRWFNEAKQNTKLWANLKTLPMREQASSVLELVEKNNGVYSIIVGATGSGKTTQVPQILLENAIIRGRGAECNILCTQPRKIAATSVAARVAVERNQPLGKQVGYHVRFANKYPEHGGSILYCTTGILIARLQAGEDILDAYSHLIIDEVHERNVETDFLLNVIKQKVATRKKVPKVVLMSATVDTELFSSYFANTSSETKCPTISVPGRTFPVQSYYLEDVLSKLKGNYQIPRYSERTNRYIEAEEQMSFKHTENSNDVKDNTNAEVDSSSSPIPVDLVTATIAHLCSMTSSGDILVFLPGLADLESVLRELEKMRTLSINFRDTEKYKIFQLHSTRSEAQAEVFEPVPTGCRKIILSTNIAETSITLPEVQYVVDTGKHRENTYDPLARTSQLQTNWISKSSAIQRAGRAGRVQNGHYLALFSRARFESLPVSSTPEIRRADLRDICLSIKAQGFTQPIQEFLQNSIEPPSDIAIKSALTDLKDLGALTDKEEVTSLGQFISVLPLSPQVAKLVVLGIIYRCLDSMLILATCSEELFRPQQDNGDDFKGLFAMGSESDHIATLNAFHYLRHLQKKGGERAVRNFAFTAGLDSRLFFTASKAITQISDQLLDTRSSPILNGNSHNDALIKALLTSILYPNLARWKSGGTYELSTPRELAESVDQKPRPANIEGNSVNFLTKASTKTLTNPRPNFLVFSTLLVTNDRPVGLLMLRNTTAIPPLTAALFGGPLSAVPAYSKKLRKTVDQMQVPGGISWEVQSKNQGLTGPKMVEFQLFLRRMEAHGYKTLNERIKKRPEERGEIVLPFQWSVARKVVEMLGDNKGYGEMGRGECVRRMVENTGV